MLEAGALVAQVATTALAARELARLSLTTVRIVDGGGGLGIPYESHEGSLDLVSFGRGLAGIVDGRATDPLLADARLLLEPGRFLVGPAGAYLATVVDTKTVDGTSVVILDGGVHHVLRPALVGTEHRVRLLSASTGRPVPATVARPLCSGLDVLATGGYPAAPGPGHVARPTGRARP